MKKKDLLNQYGIYTFNKKKMKERLPNEVYEEYLNSLDTKKELSLSCLNNIAESMKKWALELGATHYTHWFSSLNGLSAEKHDSFIEPKGIDVYYKFDEELLLKGESDASSFPSGGLRQTYKARGYTMWDYTSPSFVKDGSLYIPSLFYSYSGEALDYKTHLLKSCEVLNKEIKELLKLFNVNIDRVDCFVGVEQEYFLVSEELFNKRLDLRLTGRTLFGSSSSKGQEDAEHYFAPIEEKVGDFMKELDTELWKFGIPSKTKHNEASPNQFEVVCVYRKVNTTSDNNLLLMQLLKEIAKKHKLRCLLHEKPFKGVNGSGKHNNYSLITDSGKNLFSLSDKPLDDIPFLALLSCLIKGIDEYSDLLNLSFSSYNNDLRLGGQEAPPSIISVCLGDKLNHIIDALLQGKKEVDILDDYMDRNRTSPIAFVGNRFEFRGLGSSQSVSFINTIINSILSKEIKEMVNKINEGLEPLEIIKQNIKEHRRIIFEGDGYSSYWKDESKKRGLNKKDCLESIECLKDRKQIEVLLDQSVFSQREIDSLYQILLGEYCKTAKVEVLTSIEIVEKEIYPISIDYLNRLLKTYSNVSINHLENDSLYKKIKELNIKLEKLDINIELIKKKVNKIEEIKEPTLEKAKKYKDEVLSEMDKLREIVDNIEESIDKNNWPLPTYTDLLFSL